MVFAADFSQLKPPRQGKEPLYDEESTSFQGMLNTFIELDGKWRFQSDKEWGELLLRFQEGCPSPEDIRLINEICNLHVKTPAAGIQVATYRNKNRDTVNTALFEEYCKEHKPANGQVLHSAAVIFMDNLSMKNSGNVLQAVQSNQVKNFLRKLRRGQLQHC